MIDWQEITNGYNEMFDTTFDIKGMLHDSYIRAGRHLVVQADLLGVSQPTMWKKMSTENIRRRAPFGYDARKTLAAKIKYWHKRGGLADKTTAEIAELIKASRSATTTTLKKLGIPYKRLRND